MEHSAPHNKQMSASWDGGTPPNTVYLGEGTVVNGQQAFKRIVSELPDALVIGKQCTLDGVQFSIGAGAKIRIGDCCCVTGAILMAEMSIVIGCFVLIGWNTAIADSDFHPIAPAERIADAMACSPAGKHMVRPAVARAAVVIEDDVWIGPNCTILKGVRIGRGAWIGPGSVVTRDVAAESQVWGNPAREVERI